MRCWLLAGVMTMACSHDTPAVVHDAPRPDARQPDANPCFEGCIACPPECMHDISTCYVALGDASCIGSAAGASVLFGGGSTSRTLCNAGPVGAQHTCTAGCAVQGMLHVSASGIPTSDLATDIAEFAPHAEVLCAETPSAQVGDPCTPPSGHGQTGSAVDQQEALAKPCLPTRAQLNNDGTVASQSYLACQSGQCVAATAPAITGYGTACNAGTAAQYAGMTGAIAVTGPDVAHAWACLLVTDAAGTASAMTIQCIGDWECPDHALCDDQIANLGSGAMAVCKPGPRGTLTRTMLGQ